MCIYRRGRKHPKSSVGTTQFLPLHFPSCRDLGYMCTHAWRVLKLLGLGIECNVSYVGSGFPNYQDIGSALEYIS